MREKEKLVYETPHIDVVEIVLEDSIANSGAGLWEDIWEG